MTKVMKELMAECEVIRQEMEEMIYGRLLEVCVAMNVLRKKKDYFKMNFEDKWYDVFQSSNSEYVDVQRYGHHIARINVTEVFRLAARRYETNKAIRNKFVLEVAKKVNKGIKT